ncbi:MAG: type II toxin-antitoxin system VapC family toxin [Dehalococcoidia bacterium]
MMEVVCDASVLVKWFRAEGEGDVDAAHAVRARFERGEYRIIVPFLIFLELLNQAARRWHKTAEELEDYANDLSTLGLTIMEPQIEDIARWCGRGLTAYDACYVALAETRGIVVITADEEMLAVGGTFARALADEPPL